MGIIRQRKMSTLNSMRPLQISTSLDRFGDASIGHFNKQSTMSTTQPHPVDDEEARLREEEDAVFAKLQGDQSDQIGRVPDDVKQIEFIPRVDHQCAGTLDSSEDKSIFYKTNNAIYGKGNGLPFCTKPFKRRGLDGTFTDWCAGDVVSLGASENPIVWGRHGLDSSLTMSDCLPRTTSWGSIPCPPPTTCPGKLLSTKQ